MESKIGIVLVNYNGEKFQNKCIETIYSQTYKNFEIVVVDSNSEDKSIKKLKKNYPEVHVILEKENVGVAVGNNIGIKYCLGRGVDYILLLNNDTELDPLLLEKLIEESSPKCVTVPKIYFYEPNNLIWFGGGYIDWKRASGFHLGLRELDNGQYDTMRSISYSPTCCMLIHKSVFEQVGYIDEKTFMYYDDTDFCVRLNDSGILIKYVPDAIMWHKVSSSSGGMSSRTGIYYNNRNQFYFMRKYRKRIPMFSKIIIPTKKLLRGFLFLFKNDKYILVAYWDCICGRMGRKDF